MSSADEQVANLKNIMNEVNGYSDRVQIKVEESSPKTPTTDLIENLFKSLEQI